MNPATAETVLTKSRWALAALSGIGLTLSFPQVGHYSIAWFSLIPLILALSGASPGTSAKLGLFCGLTHGVTLYYWIAKTLHTYGDMPFVLTIPVVFLLAFYIGMFTTMVGYTTAKLGSSIRRLMVIMPMAWVVSEWLRAVLFTGFPWALLGYSQYNNPLMIQIADITGVYGVSAMIVLTNTVFAICLLHLIKCPWQKAHINRFSMYLSLFTLLVAVISVAAYGQNRLETIKSEQNAAQQFSVAVIQGNIDQSKKWDPAYQEETIKRYALMSLKASKNKPDLILWPETATPFYFLNNPELSDIVIHCAKVTETPIIFGSPSFAVNPSKIDYYNTAYALNGNGDITGRYHKTHLVPFGEYVPLKKFIPFIGKMVAQIADFSPGIPGQTLRVKDVIIGPQICYEIIFPDLSRRMVNNGAEVLINLTNDAWFGKTGAPYQHFAMSVFRAVECRRSVVRSANTGFSGHILPTGEIISKTDLFKTESKTKKIPLLKSDTSYLKYGDLFVFACFMGLFIISVRGKFFNYLKQKKTKAC